MTMQVMDSFARVDVSTLGVAYTAITAPTVKFNANQDMFPAQDIINEDSAGGGAIIWVSFDGVTDHARLGITGPTIGHSWFDHKRNRVWLRREGAASVGQMVSVYAWK